MYFRPRHSPLFFGCIFCWTSITQDTNAWSKPNNDGTNIIALGAFSTEIIRLRHAIRCLLPGVQDARLPVWLTKAVDTGWDMVTLWDRRYCVCEENEGKRMLFCPPCVVFCVMSLGRGAQTNALACDSCTTSFEQTTRLKKHVGLSFSWRPELLSSLRRWWLPSSLGTGVSRGGALSCFVSWNRPQLSALVTWRDYFWYPMCRCQCSQGLEGNQVQVH